MAEVPITRIKVDLAPRLSLSPYMLQGMADIPCPLLLTSAQGLSRHFPSCLSLIIQAFWLPGQKRPEEAISSLELDLQLVVSHHRGAGNQFYLVLLPLL